VKPNPFAGRQKAFEHLVWLVGMPVCVHAFFVLFFGLEAETAGFMLFATVMAAGSTGLFLAKGGYGPFVCALFSGWPSDVALAGHWHWTLGMASPGGSAQSWARMLGWRDPSMTWSLTALLAAAGAAGWLFTRSERWLNSTRFRS